MFDGRGGHGWPDMVGARCSRQHVFVLPECVSGTRRGSRKANRATASEARNARTRLHALFQLIANHLTHAQCVQNEIPDGILAPFPRRIRRPVLFSYLFPIFEFVRRQPWARSKASHARLGKVPIRPTLSPSRPRRSALPVSGGGAGPPRPLLPAAPACGGSGPSGSGSPSLPI